MEKVNDYGFRPAIIAPEDYLFGSGKVAGEIIREDGQWIDFLPEKEMQSRNFETFNCTSYGTINCIETLLNAKFNLKTNFSERYIGILAGTTEQGNNPHKVAETIRHEGLIEEVVLPFSEEITQWSEYYTPYPMLAEYKWLGLGWIKKWEFKHEFVNNDAETLKKALQISPLGVSVRAWQERDGLYYKNEGELDTHWTALVGYKENEYWLCFDSYEPHLKKLEWDYKFMQVKVYHVKEK